MNIRVINSSKEYNGKEALYIEELNFKARLCLCIDGFKR